MKRRLLAALLVLAACDDAPEPPPIAAVTCVARALAVVPPVMRLDVLIVLDRTASMRRRADVIADLPTLFGSDDVDLRVAVVTSELGAAIAGCAATRTAPVVPDPARCGIVGPYLHDGGAAAPTERNYPGALADALGCLLDVPITTCPVSQPLAAALAVLDGDVPALADFPRTDRANLAVVIVTDGDDCSLVTRDALAVPAGAADVEAAVDFACFAHGTVCDGDAPARLGDHTGCRHRTGGGLIDVVATARVLADRGGGAFPAGLAIIGGGDAVRVEAGPRLGAGCAERDVGPAPRLNQLDNRANERWRNACVDDWWTAPGRTFLGWFRRSLLLTCLPPAVDRQPEVPGVQASCAVATVVGLDDVVVEREAVAACADPDRDPARPCYRFDLDFAGGGFPDCTPLFIDAGDQLTRERWATVDCEVACE